jgi:hypothetical protein
VSSLAALPLDAATRICLDFVEHVNAANPALRHQLESILNPPRSSILPPLEKKWKEEAIRRQTQEGNLVPELITTAKGINIGKDLHRLKPYGALNDEIMNEYLSLLQKEAPKNVFIVKTFLSRRPDFDGISKIIIPLHNLTHWTLTILEKEHERDCFRPVLYDSLCQKAPTMPDHLREWLADLELSEESTETPNPQQSYFSQDCGLFVLLGARLATSGKPMPSQVEVRHFIHCFRRRVLAEILAGKLDPNISDFEEFQKNERERQMAACALMEYSVGRKPPPIVVDRGKEFINLISPATTVSGADLTITTAGLTSNNPATWEPTSTIDPKIISYRPAYQAGTELIGQDVGQSATPPYAVESDEEHTIESPQKESMFVSSLETYNEAVASPGESSINSLRSLPTPAPSRPSSPSVASEGSPPVISTSPVSRTPCGATSPSSTSSASSTESSQGSDSSSPSSVGNTTISRESPPRVVVSAKTCRKSPRTLVISSECSTPESIYSDRSTTKLLKSPRSAKMPLDSSQEMALSFSLEDLQTLPSVLERARAKSGQGAIKISLPGADLHSHPGIEITHSTMIQSLSFHKATITLDYERVEKQAAITFSLPEPHMDIDAAGLEKVALSFEEQVQKGSLTHVDYITDVLVTNAGTREQLGLPSSKITDPAGNALMFTSGRFDGIHTPMAYVSGGYGM